MDKISISLYLLVHFEGYYARERNDRARRFLYFQ